MAQSAPVGRHEDVLDKLNVCFLDALSDGDVSGRDIHEKCNLTPHAH